MKTHKSLIILAAAGALTLSSCTDLLDKKPLVNLAVENYYQTESDANTAIMGLYGTLRRSGAMGTYHYIHVGDNMSDDTEIGNSRSDGVRWSGNALTLMKFDVLSSNSFSGNNVWNDCFFTITTANYAIENIGKNNIPNAERYIAEAKFIRSLAYFNLTRQFGGVPVIDHVLQYEEFFSPRSSEEETWEFVEKGFEEAARDLPREWNASELGRATKGAALAMLARTYAYHASFNKQSATWQKLYDLVKEMEKENYFSLEPKYEDIFSMENENGRECCFSIQFATSKTGWGDANDGNNSAFYGHDAGISNADLNPATTTLHDINGKDIYDFVYNKMLEEFPENVNADGTPKGYLKKWTGWSLHCPTLDLVKAFEPGDPRLKATVIAPNEFYDGHTHFNLSSYSGYQSKKDYVPFAYRTDDSWEDDLPRNQIVLRWANILLYMAEGCNELGKTGEALSYLKQVRDRARNSGNDPSVLPEVTTTNKNELREAILHERRVELALEYDRYFDLARTGRLTKVMSAYYQKYGDDATRHEKGKNVQDFHSHLPIPKVAIEASYYKGVYTLEQNPGY